MKAFLDTHAAIFLWQHSLELFAARSAALIEEAALYVSPVVRLEMTLLQETGKLAVSPDAILGGLAADLGVLFSADAIEAVVGHAVALTWTRDPFDRLLVATAELHKAPFITRDERIHKHCKRAVW